jgi:parallel beta-helix repeat protein
LLCLLSQAAGLAVALVWPHVALADRPCTYFVRDPARFISAGPPDGLTPETAFSTITAGAAAIINERDVVCVGPGVYVEGNIGVGTDGSHGTPSDPTRDAIELRADPTGASTGDTPGLVRIVAPNDSFITTGFLILGHKYLVIDGFDISGFSDAGIQVRASMDGENSAFVTIRNNAVHDCAKAGIEVIAQDTVVVENNSSMGNGESGISIQMCLEAAPDGKCRGTSGVPVVPTVSNNRIGGNLSHGIFIQNAAGGLVQNNVVFHNDGSGISLRKASDVVVANNLIYDNIMQGLAVGKADLSSPRAVIFNNTIYSNFDWGIEIGSENAASPGATLVNNIVWRNGNGFKGIGVLNEASGTTPIHPPSVCGYVAGFNDVLDALPDDTPFNDYHFAFDPMFVDPAGPDGVLGGERMQGLFVDHSADDDFHLRQPGQPSASDAVDSGSAPTTDLGLTGSTATDDRPDRGTVDIGFHYGASPDQALTLAPPFMPLYVRKSGDDDLNGLTPATALGSIQTAARRAEAGITVVVGPGTYEECDVFNPGNRGKASFVADPAGSMTFDRPGAVLLDANTCLPGDTGFDISNTCGAVIDGFHVTGATEDAIRLDSRSDGAVVRNNVLFNLRMGRGVHVINSQQITVRNNLLFENKAGIQLGGKLDAFNDATTAGCRDAIIEFNTVFTSEFNGIQIGDGEGVSSGATVRYNVTAENRHGVEVGNDETRTVNLVGFTSAYNLVGDSYATEVPDGEGDVFYNLAVEPLYIDPTKIDVSGNWLNDQHWRLKQRTAGQSEDSEAVDFTDVTVEEAGLADRTTRSDGVADSGYADRGYHYPLPTHGALVGDCDGNGAVEISELITAVNIALSNAPMSACVAVDADGNGVAGINELVQAVTNATER